MRHRDGAERTPLSAIEQQAGRARLADIMLSAATDRPFADGGHALDFVNKAFECTELVGEQHAAAILPTVVRALAAARGADELNAWRHPVDLVVLMQRAFERLPAAFAQGRARQGSFRYRAVLADELLGDDPQAATEALLAALGTGARPVDLGQALAYAAALRIARFGTANEFSDWDTALHVFTYANAVHRLLARTEIERVEGYPPGVRGVFHGAMALHLTRYLNVPPARIPGERGEPLDDLPADGEALRGLLLETFDRRQQVNASARIVGRYLSEGHPAERLIATLGHALLREDADFHTYQRPEAGVRQYREWGACLEGRNILVAIARYLAAHAPTERARLQTAEIAHRLQRGGRVHEEEEEPAEAADLDTAPMRRSGGSRR
ncbi:MAG: hypothetical protein ACREH6_12555 [Geminicoccaceae bacterium]